VFGLKQEVALASLPSGVCKESFSTFLAMADPTVTKEPNNENMWPENVMIFHPSDDVTTIQTKIEVTQDPQLNFVLNGTSETTYTSANQFSEKHWALLFAPGVYTDCSFEVGYNVQVAGLGASANDVQFISSAPATTVSGPFVLALDKELPQTTGGTIAYPGSGLALNTFWRGAENFYTNSNMVWSVSQAAPLRRVYVDANLQFTEGGEYASGGVFANGVVTGSTSFNSQQQWFCRGVDFTTTAPSGGAWNIVFSGCTGNAPTTSSYDSTNKAVVVDLVPVIRAEKPFITLEGGRFKLHVPKSTVTNTCGPDLDGTEDEVRDFEDVKLGIPGPLKNDVQYNIIDQNDVDLTQELQAALEQGKDLVLCPGTFFLSAPLIIRKPNQVILGLGLATLVAPKNGLPCIQVMPGTPGVRIAGIMLEASVQDAASTKDRNEMASLLEWGQPQKVGMGDSKYPGVLSDVFATVGGYNLDRSVSTDAMIRISDSYVVGDNLWLWRADHMRLRPFEKANDPQFPGVWQTRPGECPVKNALIVNGDHVHIYGLFCEHTIEDIVIWSGNNGSVTFYQCELPYDVSNENFGEKNFVGYRVQDEVQSHRGLGVGVYSNFTLNVVHVATAIVKPRKDDVAFHYPFTVFLSNNGQIKSVINGMGPPAEPNGGPARPFIF